MISDVVYVSECSMSTLKMYFSAVAEWSVLYMSDGFSWFIVMFRSSSYLWIFFSLVIYHLLIEVLKAPAIITSLSISPLVIFIFASCFKTLFFGMSTFKIICPFIDSFDEFIFLLLCPTLPLVIFLLSRLFLGY